MAVLTLCFVGLYVARDIRRPEVWAYWKDRFLSPSLTSSTHVRLYTDSSGRPHSAIVVSGTIGAAAISWFRSKLEEANLEPGDAVVFSSPGGDVDQAILVGREIRRRGLVTAVGTVDSAGRVQPSYCASACVLAFAGGVVRVEIPGSRLGVHRFTTSVTYDLDPVVETQRMTGVVLGYLTGMGVSSSVVEVMSATTEVRWLGRDEVVAMGLVTASSVPR